MRHKFNVGDEVKWAVWNFKVCKITIINLKQVLYDIQDEEGTKFKNMPEEELEALE